VTVQAQRYERDVERQHVAWRQHAGGRDLYGVELAVVGSDDTPCSTTSVPCSSNS
jgi:hypothetical protein